MSEVKEIRTQEINHPINPNTTVVHDNILLHLLVLNDLNIKIEREVADQEKRKEKIDKINDCIQELVSRIDSKGGHVDLKNHAEFIDFLLDAEELGVRLPLNKPAMTGPSYTKLTREEKKQLITKEFKQLSAYECKRLEENLRYKMEDLNRDDATQARKIQVLFEKHEQFILMLRDTVNSNKQTTDRIANNIKG